MGTPWKLIRRIAAWHVHTQQAARRNALVAANALAERRREHEEVEEFLAADRTALVLGAPRPA